MENAKSTVEVLSICVIIQISEYGVGMFGISKGFATGKEMVHSTAVPVAQSLVQLVFISFSSASAFVVGLAYGLGLQLLRLTDKLSVLGDILFYTALISATAAPLVLLARALQKKIEAVDVAFNARALADEEASVLEDCKQRNQLALEKYEQDRAQLPRGFKWIVELPALEKPTLSAGAPSTPGQVSRLLQWLPATVLVAIAAYTMLGGKLTIAFMFVVGVAGFLMWCFDGFAVRMSGFAACALVLGFLHAAVLRTQAPDVTIQFADQSTKLSGTVVMSSQKGLIALNESRELVLLPWERIATVEARNPNGLAARAVEAVTKFAN